MMSCIWETKSESPEGLGGLGWKEELGLLLGGCREVTDVKIHTTSVCKTKQNKKNMAVGMA